jgi:hypothetical protein
MRKPFRLAECFLSILFGLALAAVAGPLTMAQENSGSIQGVSEGLHWRRDSWSQVTAIECGRWSALSMRQRIVLELIVFPSCPVGIYTITASKSGFKTQKNEDINLVLEASSHLMSPSRLVMCRSR